MQGPGGPLREGEVIGGAYRVGAPIGKGGMGTVYRAVDVTTQRTVAVKVMLPGAVTQVRLARFEREAELAARLDRNHGIARVYASGLHRGLPFIAMELIEGKDLEALLERGPLAIQHAIEVVAAVAHAVGACHAANVVHRDLKPGNVLLGEDGPKIIDFGLARDADGAGEALTRTGELVGTPFYMPPEQLAGAVVGARADVYALGAILYHTLTGRPPFMGSTLMELAARASTGRLPPPSSLRQGVSQDLDAVCMRALEKLPEDRYADGNALALDLERLRRHERPTASTQHTGWTTVVVILARARAGERRALLLVSGVSLTILGLCATIAVLLVLRPQRAAIALLGEVFEWDGDRCERLPATCKRGAHELARWDLGLGEGPAPELAEVDRRRIALESALRHLEGEDALAGKEEAARLAAVRPLLGAERDAQAARATNPTECLVDALAFRGRGDPDTARERVERALTLQPDSPAAGRLLARVWGDRVGARPVLARELAGWLRARGRTPLERALALEGATAGLPRWSLERVAHASEQVADDGTDLAKALAEGVAAAGALEIDEAVRSSILRGKQEVLEGAAAGWEGALADVVGRDSAADLRVLRRLGVALRHEPAVTPGPRLTGVLLGAIDARVALGKDEATITRAARFDAALVHEVGLDAPVQVALSEGVYGLLDGGMRVQLRDVDLDVLLTFMRSARVRGERAAVLVARAGPERVAALLQERPRSLALRLCALAAEAGEREEPTYSKPLVDLADALFVDAVVDVGLPYLVEAHVYHMRARLAQLVKAQRSGGSAEELDERAHALIDAARGVTKDADWARPDVLREALNRGAEGAALLSVEESLTWRAEGVATFERRVERARAPAGTLVGTPLSLQEERRNLARILHTSANWLDDVAERRPDRAALRERASAWWREVLEVCVQLDDTGADLAAAIRASHQGRRP